MQLDTVEFLLTSSRVLLVTRFVQDAIKFQPIVQAVKHQMGFYMMMVM